jgi:RHS repeat-associated protein
MLRLRHLAVSLPLFVAFALFVFSPQPAQAKYIGGDPPACGKRPLNSGGPWCATCQQRRCKQRLVATPNSSVSLTEGTNAETYSGPVVKSAFGPTLMLDLTYNSYDADGSRASINTVLGYGWTHNYNEFLFSQRGDIFRFQGDGRIVRYAFQGNGVYQTSTGYFETLKQNSNGCAYNLTDTYQTQYCFQSIPGTPFLVNGPVFRLSKITDRNGNVTTLTYTAGNLSSITDTYGRSLTLAYDGKNHLMSVTDPDSRVTQFTYNAAGNLLTRITDPTGATTSYSYNYLYQITSKKDRDGQMFTLGYQNGLPSSESDGNGASLYGLTNPLNWATDPMELSKNLMRVYMPTTTSQTDGRGNVWKYQYDSHGYPLTITAPDGATTMYTYDPNTLEVASQTDANGNTTQYTYDGQGNLLSRKDANGNVTSYTYDPMFNQVLSMTDPQGRVTTYTYDGNGNRLSETDPLGGMRSWTYDSHGNVLTETDKNGNTTTYTYDGFGNRLQTTDALGDVTKYTYDGVGNMASMTDADGNLTQYQYDGLNRLTLITDALNGKQQYFYDGEGDRIKQIDQDGNPTTFSYDTRHRLITTTDATNHNDTYAYDGNNNRTSMTDRNGHTTNYAYDVQNRLTKVTDALGDVTTYAYDGVGNRTAETDANSHTTTYQYDTLNRRIQKKDALSEITTWGYDLTNLPGCPVPPGPCSGPTLGSDLVTKQTDANGKVIYYVYDGLDRTIIEIHKQAGTAYDIVSGVDAVTYSFYDPNSNPTKGIEPDGNSTTYAYDAVNRQIQMVQVETGDTTTTTYDPFGNVHISTAPNGNVTTYGYDALNRRTSETDSVGAVSTTSYDPVGNVTGMTDGDGNPTSYAYDMLNRRMTMTDALGHSTQYFYDPVGNLTKVIDRDNNPTSYAYDAINRRISITDAQPATTQYQYDPVGNLTKLTDANGHATTFAYDAVNRRISETYPDLANNTVTYAYDAVGNRISRTDQNGNATSYNYTDLYFLKSRAYQPSMTADRFTYDLSGRVLTANTNRGTGWANTFSYDGANRLIQSIQNGQMINIIYNIPGRTRALTYPGGRMVKEQWDFRPRLSSINDGGLTPIVQYSYDFSNNVLTRGYRNGVVGNRSYNANNWTCSINDSFGATLIVGFTYAYDNEGNKFYEQKLHLTTDSEAYAYDSIYRLVNYRAGSLASSPPPNCPAGPVGIPMPVTQTAYNLDKLGNWNSIVVTPPGGAAGTQTRMHSPSNEIAKINGTFILSDNNGNTTDDGTNLYSYDEENRLVKVTAKVGGAVLGRYQYDAFGKRISKIDNFAVQTLFYYDGWRTIEEQSSGVTQATYVFGNYLDEVLTMDRGGATYYYHQNALWSVMALSDSTGKALEGYSYDAYGYQTVHLPGPDGILWTSDDILLPGAKSSVGNPFLFTGQRYDPETGLLYYKARHYSTFFGRFMQRDPMDYRAGDINLYEYVKDNPVNHTDPSGAVCCQCWIYGTRVACHNGSCGFCSNFFDCGIRGQNETEWGLAVTCRTNGQCR